MDRFSSLGSLTDISPEGENRLVSLTKSWLPQERDVSLPRTTSSSVPLVTDLKKHIISSSARINWSSYLSGQLPIYRIFHITPTNLKEKTKEGESFKSSSSH